MLILSNEKVLNHHVSETTHEGRRLKIMCISDSRISDDDMIEIFPVFELSKETESEPRQVSSFDPS